MTEILPGNGESVFEIPMKDDVVAVRVLHAGQYGTAKITTVSRSWSIMIVGEKQRNEVSQSTHSMEWPC